MKVKTIMAAALLSCSFFTAKAQTGPYIGVTSSYNATWVLDQKLFDDQNYDSRSTWDDSPIGFTVGYKFSRNTNFQIELNKNTMGAEYDILGSQVYDGERTVIGEKNIEIKYWSVPVLYKLTTGDKVRFNFHLGPQFSFLTEGKEVNEFTSTGILKITPNGTDLTAADAASHPNTTTTDPEIRSKSALYQQGENDERATKDDFNQTDIGALLGLGLEADIIGNLYISGNVRVYYGFKDIRSDARKAEAESRGYYDSRNNATVGFQVGLHYRFDL
ncbi:MAG TPA: outer membrane beta-barrel protein [Adhaeribacter sp.]|nr:outer membrane beta-barrel protein [Adhaeribacter sp.]